MLSIRALARSAPRTVCRQVHSAAFRPASSLRHPSVLQSSWTASRSRIAAPFSTSRNLREKQGEFDDELVAKFDSELQMEKQMRDSDEVPVGVRDYLENGPFQITDTPGQEEVVLNRQFGNENIRVSFSVADLNNMNEDPEEFDDRAQYDEEDYDGNSVPTDTQSGGAQSKHTVNAGRTEAGNVAVAPEDSVAPSDRSSAANETGEGEDGEEAEPSFPARLSVTITKPGLQGALHIETMAQDGTVVIDNVYYHADSSTVPTAGSDDAKDTGAYLGPPFGNLDDDLQVLLERYLDERGVNTALALFVPDYIDYKEQKEYLNWLSNVKSFIET
ncbi:MAG: hypothetical protein M1837_001234 [Sclerophora amabilis]|nr:MAG: hypothetical protein M1837_001234 [Sclerophora amabilis]